MVFVQSETLSYGKIDTTNKNAIRDTKIIRTEIKKKPQHQIMSQPINAFKSEPGYRAS